MLSGAERKEKLNQEIITDSTKHSSLLSMIRSQLSPQSISFFKKGTAIDPEIVDCYLSILLIL